MDIQFYETFLEVADTLSFRAASDNLGVVQSTVSNRIQALEEYYGKTLFNRSNKKVSLTKTGNVVLPYAQRIVRLHKEALVMSKRALKHQSVLKLAIDPGLYCTDCSNLINTYIENHPETSVEITLESSKKVLAGLSDGVYDVGFVYNKAKFNHIEFIPYVKDPFVFIAGKMDDLEYPIITKSEMLHMNLVKVEYGEKFDSWLKQIIPKDYTFNLKLDKGANPAEHILNYNRAGFILESALESLNDKSRVQTLRIKGLDMPYFQSYFVYKSSEERTEAVTNFMNTLNLQK